RAGDRTGTVFVLADAAGTVRAEVWPFAGFNCLRWQVRVGDRWGDLLYTAPDWETNPVPTRSGHPVLFPFPNRMRDGRFAFHGTEYTFPKNDPAKANAIHGFTPRQPWPVVAVSATATDAAVTGEFRLSRDVPPGAGTWPADATLSLTYRLTATALRVEATVTNHGPGPLPFGLGYHPYFRIPTAPDASADEFVLWTAATSLWETEGGVPTGTKLPLPAAMDFRKTCPVSTVVLDSLFGDLDGANPTGDGLRVVAELGHTTKPGKLTVAADPAFGELVLFTPQHRTAIAIEPYTCTTDAANLESRGIPAGWREIGHGETLAATTEYSWQSGSMSENPALAVA
ncbi:MAG: aldose 1-epimerase, partial [Fimbriiglobus sp.]